MTGAPVSEGSSSVGGGFEGGSRVDGGSGATLCRRRRANSGDGMRRANRDACRERRGFGRDSAPSESTLGLLKKMLHDRMTEEEYVKPIETFESGAKTEPTVRVPIMAEGRKALERINEERGLGFDEFDLDFYTELFKVRLD